MQAGKLDQLIEIIPIGSASTIDSHGDTAQAVEMPVTVWANVRQQGADEKARNGIKDTENTFAIRIRWRGQYSGDMNVPDRPFPDTTATIRYRGRSLAISSVVEAGQNNREWIDIRATEVR